MVDIETHCAQQRTVSLYLHRVAFHTKFIVRLGSRSQRSMRHLFNPWNLVRSLIHVPSKKSRSPARRNFYRFSGLEKLEERALLANASLDALNVDIAGEDPPTVVAAPEESTNPGDLTSDEVAALTTWTGGENWSLLDDTTRRSLWVWNSFTNNADGKQELLLDFLENKSIRDVYMFGSTFEWNQSSLNQGKVPNENFWVQFNTKANERGIRVWLLYYLYDDIDDPRMMTNNTGIIKHAVAVNNFNNTHPEAAFAGMQSDQEPNDPAVYTGLLENMKVAQEYIDANEGNFLSSQALRPKWRNQNVTWNGVTKPMNEHIMDTITHGVLMAYNDNVNTVRTWANQIVNYATTIGKQVAIGFETGNLNNAYPSAASETWWEEILAEPLATRFQVNHSASPVTFEDAMNTTSSEQLLKAGYDRQAIHSYDVYFRHWFGMTPSQYIASIGGFYNSSVINPPKIDLTEDDANYNPIAYDDWAQTSSSTPVNIHVLANDFDLDDDILSIQSFTQGANGIVTNNNDGTLKYTAVGGYSGSDSFTYVVTDGKGNTQTRTVTIEVEASDKPGDLDGDGNVNGDDLAIWQEAYGTSVAGDADGDGDTDGRDFLIIQRNFDGNNNAPIATDDIVHATQDQAKIIDVLANDMDPDQDLFSIESFTQASHGAVSDNGDGTLTYTPASGYQGSDSFTYTIVDSNGGTSQATVSITVTSSTSSIVYDFESGSLSGWSANNAFITTNSAHGGSYSARLGTGTSNQGLISRTISDLTANTAYRLTLWVSSSNEADTYASVSAYGGTTIQQYQYVGLGWSQVTIEFTTGVSNTSATITVFANPYNKAVLGEDGYDTSVAYVDDLVLTML